MTNLTMSLIVLLALVFSVAIGIGFAHFDAVYRRKLRGMASDRRPTDYHDEHEDGY